MRGEKGKVYEVFCERNLEHLDIDASNSGNVRIKVTLRRVRVTIVAVEKQ